MRNVAQQDNRPISRPSTGESPRKTQLWVDFYVCEQSEPTPSESPSEAEIEPSPIPGTEILLEPQLPPLPGKTLKLGPPGVVEPILPPSGRLWSFHVFLYPGRDSPDEF